MMMKNRSRFHGPSYSHSHSYKAGTPDSWVTVSLNGQKRKVQANGVHEAQQEEGQGFVAGAYLDHYQTHRELVRLLDDRCDN